MGSSDKRKSSLTVRLVAKGNYGCVWLSDEAWEAYDELQNRADAQGIQEARAIKRYFERFAEHGPSRLDNDKMFKRLGRFKDGTGKQVAVFEFKAYQWRVYGVQRHHQGVPCFVGLCCDPDKKKNKANPALLNKCAQLSADL